MDVHDFRESMLSMFDEFTQAVATDAGDWVVKGLIDVYRNIYTISVDTKVVSKIIELLLFPLISRFAAQHRYKMVLAEHQNYYPDISLIASNGAKIALDLKSTYRRGPQTVSGFTLGAFTGYFRQRSSTKNISLPYEQYAKHFVLGVIYSRSQEVTDERRVYALDQIQDIVSVVRQFTFLLHEKWRLASDRPGSGNTKNIGSVKKVGALIEGTGPFALHGEQVFDDYWMNYLTSDMAMAIESQVPYRNLQQYFDWKKRGVGAFIGGATV